MGLLSLLQGLAWPALAQEATYSGSLRFSTGSYVFEQRTHSFSLSTAASFRVSRFELYGSIPLIFQNGGVVSYVGDAPVPTGGPLHGALRQREPGSTVPSRRREHMGGTGGVTVLPPDSIAFADAYELHLGDPLVDGSWEIHSGTGAFRSARLSAGAKAPVADLESGVGTGRWDFSTGGSLVLSAAGVYMFGDLTYWWYGDLPDLELRDGPTFGLAVGRALSGGNGSLLVGLSGARSSVATLDPPLSLTVSGGYRLRAGRSLSLGAGVGLSESSPDLSLFLGWSLSRSP